jgi:membrane-associated protease RseP (regulator of RpoE activity)
VRKAKPGETANIIAMRKDDKKTFQVKLGKAPRESDLPAMALVRPHVSTAPNPHIRIFSNMASRAYGLEMMDLNKQLGEYFGAPDKKGVLIESVEKKSTADKAGFKAGDVIVKIGKDRIEDTRDVWDALEDYTSGDKVNFEILRRGNTHTLTLEAEDPEDLETQFRHQSIPWGNDHRLMYQYENQAFKGQMEKLKEELNAMTRKLREQARTIQSKVSREVRNWVGS